MYVYLYVYVYIYIYIYLFIYLSIYLCTYVLLVTFTMHVRVCCECGKSVLHFGRRTPGPVGLTVGRRHLGCFEVSAQCWECN